MPKGHPISVPRTWPGHRDYEPREIPASELFDAIRREQQARWNALPREAKARIGLVPECPVPGGSCLRCDDDHCREL